MQIKIRRSGLLALTAAAVILFAVGCGGGFTRGVSEEIRALEDVEVTADAYLFDARIVRDGKPTSVRLEIYYTDTLIGIGGRGYLGKGALKGWLSEDSLKIYFPSSNEYVYDAVRTVMESEACPDTRVDVPLAGLLSTPPDSLALSSDVVVLADYEEEDEPYFAIEARACPWRIDIVYDRHDGQWQVKAFEFDNGADISLTATRRTVRHGVEVDGRRFGVAIPDDALRIAP